MAGMAGTDFIPAATQATKESIYSGLPGWSAGPISAGFSTRMPRAPMSSAIFAKFCLV
jgi:hypothetical protein